MPERTKSSDKTAKKPAASNKKDKNRSQGSEDFARKKKDARMQASMMDDDALARHRKKPKPKTQQKHNADQEDQIKVVALPDSMTVMEFAEYLNKPATQIIKALMMKGVMAGLNQQIEFDQAEEIAMDMGILVEHEVEEDIFAAYADPHDDEEDLVERPPVVVVMGHVDHGKTSLLDKIRSTRVTAGEAGGITQSIGASVVQINGRQITFLDTPGHEAFTAMRLRGAQATDIAILVVAADDGVMPQTVEAISHAKTAGVQIIVAINKMDKPGANPDRVMQELTEYELIPEAWGGSTICVPVSALTGEGIDTLLEMVLLTADMEEYKANPDAPASGVVIEAELDRGRGAVATVLVQRGTLHMGDPIVVGNTYGRIKSMQDDTGKRIKTAGPSMPAEIIGLDNVPAAGERFFVTPSDREARVLAEKVAARERQNMIEGNKRVSLEDLFGQIQEGEMKELNIVVKADTQGSV
ncbi:MAG: translation initiation factor IF-2, partial [Firmicutes bacterium]|nr:translation initiation factor IF-2 [Bacillota bacterium]